MTSIHDRIKGCLMGLMCGDALGSPIEFKTPEQLAAHFPRGVRGMEAGWGSTAGRVRGEITDDSEMALSLLDSLVQEGGFHAACVRQAYIDWLDSDPPDAGTTIRTALWLHEDTSKSEANGALMRVAPLAIWGAVHPEVDVLNAAVADARITHTHPKCAVANVVYVAAVKAALLGHTREEIYSSALKLAEQFSPEIHALLLAAADCEPDYYPLPGWLHHALQAAFYQLLHAESYKQALCSVVNRLGDPDTNGAIVGALLGAYFGEAAIPAAWREAVLTAHVNRPERYSARHAEELLNTLLAARA